MRKRCFVLVVSAICASSCRGISLGDVLGTLFDRKAPAPPSLKRDLPHKVVIVLRKPPKNLEWFDDFSWKSFVALNWPVAMKDGQPLIGVPAQDADIGDAGTRVWETWKTDNELFLPNGDVPGAWDAPRSALVSLCQVGTATADRFFGLVALPTSANQALSGPLVDRNKNYVRYEIHFNQTYYDTVRNEKWYLRRNLPRFPNKLRFPASTKDSYGAVMVKAAWREMDEEADAGVKGRYYTVKALLLERTESGDACREATMGLVGFHIVHKTKPFEQWVWSTFEHVDNVQSPSADMPASFGGGSAGTSDCSKPSTTDSWSFDCNGFKPLLARMPLPADSPYPVKKDRTPTQVRRVTEIPAKTQALNKKYQALLKGMVWEHYELVATQWPERGGNIDGDRTRMPDWHEDTNRPYPYVRGMGRPFPQDDVANTTLETYFQAPNSLRDPRGDLGTSCMHCHYLAAETDFSYALQNMACPRGGAYPGQCKADSSGKSTGSTASVHDVQSSNEP